MSDPTQTSQPIWSETCALSTLQVADYCIIENYESTEFGKAVNGHLRKGWSLYGPPICRFDNYLCQAMVRYEEEGGA